MAVKHLIRSSVNGLEQEVTPEQLQVLKSHGWKGKIVSTTETPKAKAPAEIAEKAAKKE
jgi:hypothetical protein